MPPTLATQLNNGDILRAPARRPAAIPGSSRSSPPLPAACRERSQLARPDKVSPRPPPGAGRRHRELAALGRLPAAAPAAAAVRPEKCRAGPGPCPAPAALRLRGPRCGRSSREGGKGAGSPSGNPPENADDRLLPHRVALLRNSTQKTGFSSIKKKKKSHAVHVTFWEHAGIELTLNIKRSSKKSSL